MVCGKCGAANSGDAMFCENCGADLREAYMQDTQEAQGMDYMPAPAVKKRFSKWFFLLAAEAIGLVLLVFAGVTVMDGSNSAEKTAERYFINVANGDWQEAYELLQLADMQGMKRTFISQEAFEEAQGKTSLGIVENYRVRPEGDTAGNGGLAGLYQQGAGLGSEGSSLAKSVTIDYQLQDSMESGSYVVDLQGMDGNWKVKSMDLVCQDYCIYVPAGASVSVDGIFLEGDYGISEEDAAYYSGMDGYLIPYIFYGMHEVKVTMEGMEDVADAIRLEYGSSPYYLEHMPLKQETMEELLKKSRENMQQIYSAALEGKNIKTMEGLFTAEAERLQEIQESYQYLLSDFHEGSVQPEKISFYDMIGEVSGESSSVSLQFRYKMEYVQERWNGELVRDTYEGNDEIQFYYVNEDGKWVLENLGCRELY